MDLLTWILVGLIAGVLASFLMGGIGYGMLGDILIGILGAFFGAWLFAQLGVTSPFEGLAGTIFVAFIGAVVLLFLPVSCAVSSGRDRWYGRATRAIAYGGAAATRGGAGDP